MTREDWEPGDALMMLVMQPPPAPSEAWIEVELVGFDHGHPMVKLGDGQLLACHEQVKLRRVR